jgi:hypothetical protein
MKKKYVLIGVATKVVTVESDEELEVYKSELQDEPLGVNLDVSETGVSILAYSLGVVD